MKKPIFILVFMVAFAIVTNAQRVVALHSSNGTSVFSGVSPFVDAYNAAQPGDTIYLSGGSFANPPLIDKKLMIFGAGYNPNFTSATNPTLLTGNFTLGENSDNTVVEGIHFAATIVVDYNVSASFITFKRCRIDGAIYFSGDLSNPSVNNVFAECIIFGDNLFDNAANISITNSIINYRFRNSRSNSIKNNIFLGDGFHWTDGYFTSPFYNEISNNIFRGNVNICAGGTDGNIWFNNVFVQATPNMGNNPITNNNYLSVPLENIFVNYTDGTFNYQHDYHLQYPETYVGSDGTQTGIYGGLFPFKTGGVPVNPHISLKNIASQTTPSGELSIQIEVEAQNQ
jgi:hypothetical protein